VIGMKLRRLGGFRNSTLDILMYDYGEADRGRCTLYQKAESENCRGNKVFCLMQEATGKQKSCWIVESGFSLLLSRLVKQAPAGDVCMRLRRIKPERVTTSSESLLMN
jgi:hypothetical protein